MIVGAVFLIYLILVKYDQHLHPSSAFQLHRQNLGVRHFDGLQSIEQVMVTCL
jgi:hypothetical protein